MKWLLIVYCVAAPECNGSPPPDPIAFPTQEACETSEMARFAAYSWMYDSECVEVDE